MYVRIQPMPHLFKSPNRTYSVPCDEFHPDTNRIVILFEKPSKANHGQGLSVSGRYKDGKYYGVITGNVLPIKFEETVWMESPFCEGPYYVVSTKIKKISKEHDNFTDPKEAAESANELNLVGFGNPTYTVVNEDGYLVDHEGFLTATNLNTL